MTAAKTDILVYAHWSGMEVPRCIGTLAARQAKGRKAFSFSYDSAWFRSKEQLLLDPDIAWYSGPQYPDGKENFGLFMDSMPDTWGRKLMRRRAAQKAGEEGLPAPILYDIDYLLGVSDESRMGALRFKLDANGPFLDNNHLEPVPPIAHIKELQFAAEMVESGEEGDAVKKWLEILIAPGSSLGGARPKANVKDNSRALWIAKFPSRSDAIDKAAWEFLAYQLALQAGIQMAESKIERIAGKHHTFLTRRFDRMNGDRIHFASAMTMTGQNEETIKENPASYLDIAEFIQFNGARNTSDLRQLWRRIVFNIAISNTDDHLRNHGFILTNSGWVLSPAFDINPSTEKSGLALNIDTEGNALDFDLARSIGGYFQLPVQSMDQIISEVRAAVKNWRSIAGKIGIPKDEQEYMATAFQ